MTIKCSYEFFPPGANAIGERRFWRTLGCLETLDPTFFSITYGALGSAQENSLATIKNVLAETDIPIAAHLTFEGATTSEIAGVAKKLRDMGIDKVVALRGDDRENAQSAAQRGPVYESVSDFIAGLHEIYPFDISVACYPEVHPKAISMQDDILELKRKADAGASRAITQFFFDLDAMDRFQERVDAAGINIPVVPGVLPVKDFNKMVSFAKRCGASVPAELYDYFKPAESKPELAASLGRAYAEELIDSLQTRGYEHFHIYTLNQPIKLTQCATATGVQYSSAANA